MERYALFWSGGKDSALALWELLRRGKTVSCLITTITLPYHRVTMHGLSEVMLKRQIAHLHIPIHLDVVPLPQSASNELYVDAHTQRFQKWKSEFGITHLAFGDIFLQDIREFREQVFGSAFSLAFPLWGESTHDLAWRLLHEQFQAVIICLDKRKLDRSWLGKPYDEAFLRSLPSEVDPCGENGEFHTFIYNGPLFKEPIPFTLDQIHETDDFLFQELVKSPACKVSDLRPTYKYPEQ